MRKNDKDLKKAGKSFKGFGDGLRERFEEIWNKIELIDKDLTNIIEVSNKNTENIDKSFTNLFENSINLAIKMAVENSRSIESITKILEKIIQVIGEEKDVSKND